MTDRGGSWHGDKKDEPQWPKMHTGKELVETCTIIDHMDCFCSIFMQLLTLDNTYPFAGYLASIPNPLTVSRRFMPEKGNSEYDELESNPDKALLRTITAQPQTVLGISLIEMIYLGILASDEVRVS